MTQDRKNTSPTFNQSNGGDKDTEGAHEVKKEDAVEQWFSDEPILTEKKASVDKEPLQTETSNNVFKN